jgi:hypothetical protein
LRGGLRQSVKEEEEASQGRLPAMDVAAVSVLPTTSHPLTSSSPQEPWVAPAPSTAASVTDDDDAKHKGLYWKMYDGVVGVLLIFVYLSTFNDILFF